MKIFHAGYKDCLLGVDLERYENKIKLLEMDPYEADINVTVTDINKFTNIESWNIYHYLVNTTNAFTMEQFKALKSLNSHNFLTSGWISSLTAMALPDEKVIVFGEVKHSYSVNEEDLKVWVAANINGDILTSHCTCVAGISESCSHIGATLFSLEYAGLLRRYKTCTSMENSWLPPKLKNVPCVEVEDISFKSDKQKYKEMQMAPYVIEEGSNDNQVSKKKKFVSTPITEEERKKYIEDSLADDEHFCLMYIVPECSDVFKTTDKADRQGIPPSLKGLYDKKYWNFSLEELRAISLDIFKAMKVSVPEINVVEEKTKKQSESPLWNEQRAGRITASITKDIMQMKIDDPSVSVVKNICYRETFFSPYTQYGIKNEKKVQELFISQEKNKHKNFKFQQCGFKIHKEHNFIGASSDGMTFCDCHGWRLVEIKCICPFVINKKSKNKNKENNNDENNDNNKKNDADNQKKVKNKINRALTIGTKLPEDHEFFYQVQTQLLCWELTECTFIVFHPEIGLMQQPILANKEIQDDIVAKSSIVFKEIILPELLARYFSSAKNTYLGEINYDPELSCLCQRPAKHPMIKCDYSKCAIKFFHWQCVNVKGRRKSWCCSTKCSEEIEKMKSAKNSVLGELNYGLGPTCLCQKPAASSMITCDNIECPIKFFHWQCVNVKKTRKTWSCYECTKKKKEMGKTK